MKKPAGILKGSLIAACIALVIGMTGCSSDSGTSSSISSTANALPQPSVNCGGSSCIK